MDGKVMAANCQLKANITILIVLVGWGMLVWNPYNKRTNFAEAQPYRN